ncbi:MAG: MCE family protein, partial [Bdellovibrionales bacterium]
ETNTLVTNPGDGSTVSDLDEKKTYKNKTKFTALYGMNFWDLTVRGGLIESSGGLGIDYHFFRKKLKFTMEAFDFGDTNLRFQASYKVAWGLYVLAGFEDALDNQGKQSGYLGAGLFLTNDDLKLLLVRGPF